MRSPPCEVRLHVHRDDRRAASQNLGRVFLETKIGRIHFRVSVEPDYLLQTKRLGAWSWFAALIAPPSNGAGYLTCTRTARIYCTCIIIYCA